MGEQGKKQDDADLAPQGPRAGDAGGAGVGPAGAKATVGTGGQQARLVFGDPLERQSSDDTDSGWGERPGAGDGGGRGLDWYLSQRPPHHGG
ncbi:hypothetical protein [Kitasatospora sp. NPDC050543]|uniref:hypothetical protein n=1 Tax=Kitasatospora sp. NPDC050543 TaxID=3364054 RepID=UPI00379A7D49